MAALSERDRESVSLFVDEMKADRAQRKWSQAELARQAHCSESSIAMVESYQRPPTASLAKALDKAFGTSGTYARMERRLCNLPFPASFRSFAPVERSMFSLVSVQATVKAQKPNVRLGSASEHPPPSARGHPTA